MDYTVWSSLYAQLSTQAGSGTDVLWRSNVVRLFVDGTFAGGAVAP